MPVSARLSRSLAQTLGEEAAADMVDWMQRVDTQRIELRDHLESRFTPLDARLAQIEAGIARIETAVETRMDQRFAAFELTMEQRFGAVERQIESTRADLMKWMLVFWMGAVGSIAVLAGVRG